MIRRKDSGLILETRNIPRKKIDVAEIDIQIGSSPASAPWLLAADDNRAASQDVLLYEKGS